MKIPDELLAWGLDPEQETRWARPWAREIRDILSRAGDHALKPADYQRLLARLEALCVEAIRAKRADLLDHLDTRLAEAINLTYRIDVGDGKIVEVGNKGRFSWGELRSLLATDDPKGALKAMDEAKNLLGDVFRGARVEVSDKDGEAPDVCASCRTGTSCVMMMSESGSRYCGKCWLELTDENPMTIKRSTKRERAGRDEQELPLEAAKR